MNLMKNINNIHLLDAPQCKLFKTPTQRGNENDKSVVLLLTELDEVNMASK